MENIDCSNRVVLYEKHLANFLKSTWQVCFQPSQLINLQQGTDQLPFCKYLCIPGALFPVHEHEKSHHTCPL